MSHNHDYIQIQVLFYQFAHIFVCIRKNTRKCVIIVVFFVKVDFL